MTDLLPCPFCWGEAKVYSRDNGHGCPYSYDTDYWVSCEGEDCCASVGMFDCEEGAINNWNTRATPPADQVWNAAIDAARQVIVYGVLDGWIARQDDASRLIMKVIRRDVSRAIAALRKDSK